MISFSSYSRDLLYGTLNLLAFPVQNKIYPEAQKNNFSFVLYLVLYIKTGQIYIYWILLLLEEFKIEF